MDLSKLPKLSETDKHTPMPPPPEPQPVEYSAPGRSIDAPGGEAWLGVAVGAIVQLMSTRFWSFVGSKIFGTAFTWTFTDVDGVSPLAYTQSVYFFGDLALVLFGLVLIAEAAVAMAPRNRLVLRTVLALTVIATLLNLVYLIQMMAKGYGLQLMAALAVAFGIYIASYQWRLLQAASARA